MKKVLENKSPSFMPEKGKFHLKKNEFFFQKDYKQRLLLSDFQREAQRRLNPQNPSSVQGKSQMYRQHSLKHAGKAAFSRYSADVCVKLYSKNHH